MDDAIHQAQQLASGFKSKLGPVYSVRSTFQTTTKPDGADDESGRAPVSAQETYQQAAIQFDDQVDVVFQLEPVDQQPAKTPAAQ
ncbi:SIMPL domain-containing protein [Shigella flexneri]